MTKRHGKKKRKASGLQQEPPSKSFKYSEREAEMKKETKSEPDSNYYQSTSTSYQPNEIATNIVNFRKWCETDPVISLNFERTLMGVTFSETLHHLSYVEDTRKKYPEQCAELDGLIWHHYKSNGQTSQIYEWKMKVRNMLFNECRNLFYENKDVGLWAVGSTVNGCGSFNSDMDLCLVLPDNDSDEPYCLEKSKCLRYLRKLQNCFRNKPAMKKLVKNAEVISKAKVPIIKVDLYPPYQELDLDININNVAGVYNSHLIHYYSRVDQRFPALCLLVKHWAIRNEISDALNGTFNSYSLILLVLHYLQCGVQPAVLPNLQYLMPTIFNMETPLNELELFRELEGLPESAVNLMPIGDLLMGFFHYYHAFDFERYAISIRKGAIFPRSEISQEEHQKYFIFIEEPFDQINTARCVVRQNCFDKIRECIKTAHRTFITGPPDLAKIQIYV